MECTRARARARTREAGLLLKFVKKNGSIIQYKSIFILFIIIKF